jgi:hypothetical protein
VPTDPDRRGSLLAAKLGALVRAGWEGAPAEAPSSVPGGALLVDPAQGRVWALLDDRPERRLGALLALAQRRSLGEVHVITDDAAAAAVLARRTRLVASGPQVWHLVGAELQPAVPAAPAVDLAPPPDAELYLPVLVDAGLEVVVEGGHLAGEVLGLECARVVVGEAGAHVEAGVGRFDREVGAMMFAELAEVDALARAVDLVREHRRADAPRHPLNQLVPDRWLRSVVVARPELVGAVALRPVGGAVPRTGLRDDGVATAVGVDADGAPIVVSCSTGVHLDLVPSAADDRLAHAPEARLVLVVPEADAMAITTDLAAHLVAPAEVVALPGDWRRLHPEAVR